MFGQLWWFANVGLFLNGEQKGPIHSGTELGTTTKVTSMADQNGQQGNELENISTITSLSDESGEQEIGNAPGGPVNHNEPLHDERSRRPGFGHHSFLYRAVSVFPHPARDAIGRPRFYFIMVRASPVIPDQAQFSLIPISIQTGNIYLQEPMHDERYRRSGFGHNSFLYRAVAVFPHPARDTIGRRQFYFIMVMASPVMPDFNLIPTAIKTSDIYRQELMHDERSPRSGYGHNPFAYRVVSVFRHPDRNAIGRPLSFYVMVRVPTLMPDQAQFTSIPNAVQTGNIYHQEQSCGSLPPLNANYRIPGHGIIHHVARFNHTGGSLNSGHIHGGPGMSINPGVMHQTNPRANSLSSNVRDPQHQPQQLFSVSYSRGPSLGHCQSVRPSSSTAGFSSNRFIPDPTSSSTPSSSTAGLPSNRFIPNPTSSSRPSSSNAGLSSNGFIPDPASSSRPSSSTAGLYSNRFIPDPISSSRPSSSTHAGLSCGDQARFSRMSSRNTSLARFPNEQNPFELQHGHENINRVLPIVPSSINMQNQPGIEMRREPVGSNCIVCNGHLRLAPGNIETEPPFQPEVSVFSCGHAYHSECFRGAVKQKQSADTPCYFCTLRRP